MKALQRLQCDGFCSTDLGADGKVVFTSSPQWGGVCSQPLRSDVDPLPNQVGQLSTIGCQSLRLLFVVLCFSFCFGETISHFPDISLLHRLENHSRFPLNCSADIVTVGLRSPLTVQRPQVFVYPSPRGHRHSSESGFDESPRSGYGFIRRRGTTPPLGQLFRIGDQVTCRRRTVKSSA